MAEEGGENKALVVVKPPKKIVFDPLGGKELEPEASTKFPQTYAYFFRRADQLERYLIGKSFRTPDNIELGMRLLGNYDQEEVSQSGLTRLKTVALSLTENQPVPAQEYLQRRLRNWEMICQICSEKLKRVYKDDLRHQFLQESIQEATQALQTGSLEGLSKLRSYLSGLAEATPEFFPKSVLIEDVPGHYYWTYVSSGERNEEGLKRKAAINQALSTGSLAGSEFLRNTVAFFKDEQIKTLRGQTGRGRDQALLEDTQRKIEESGYENFLKELDKKS